MDAEQITNATIQIFGVSRADLMGPSRAVRIAKARQALSWALRTNGWSLGEIGKLLGNRDHTSIIYNLAAVDQRKERDPDYAEQLQALAGALKSDATHPICVCGCAEEIRLLKERLARLEATP